MYAVFRRIEEFQSYYKQKTGVIHLTRIYRTVAEEFGYMTERPVIEIYGFVLKNKYKPEFKREKLLYDEGVKNYNSLYSSEEDRKNIEKIRNAKSLSRENTKSQQHYYIYKRYEELSANKNAVKGYKTDIYMDIADEFHLRNHNSVSNIISAVKKILFNVKCET